MAEGTDGDERVSMPLEIGAAVSLRPRARSAWSSFVRALFAMRAGELALWIVGVGATGTAFVEMRAAERERVQLAFAREALGSFDLVKQELAAATDVVAGYANHLEIVPRERCYSQSYARSALARHPSLRGLSWDTVIRGDELASFEATQRRERPAFRVTERNARGDLVPVGARERYVVVTCIEPEDGNAKAIGFDLSSDPVRAEAIDKTLVSHTPAATARIRLVQETGRAVGVLLLQAVVDEASHANLGCVSAVLRIDDLFDRSLRSIPSGSAVALYDGASDEQDALYTVGDPAIEKSGYRVELPVNVADRPWLLRASIAPGEVERRMSMQPWAWFVAGLVTTWLASRTLRSQRAARDLLRNVLPRHIAERLTQGRRRVAERHDNVSVLFADLVGFTAVAGRLGADELVRMLDDLFSGFDRITDDLGLEKIKTIGDCYMLVGGLKGDDDHLYRTVQAARSLLAFARRRGLELRVGIHVGPVIAGVIGRRRLAFDLWGDTVNIASRMESFGVPNRIVLSDEAYAALGERIRAECREPMSMKGVGERTSWLLFDDDASQVERPKR